GVPGRAARVRQRHVRGAVRGLVRGHRHPPQALQIVRGRPVMTTVLQTTGTAAPVATPATARTRKRGGSWNRDRLLVVVARHSIAIALGVMFLAPVIFLVLTSF